MNHDKYKQSASVTIQFVFNYTINHLTILRPTLTCHKLKQCNAKNNPLKTVIYLEL